MKSEKINSRQPRYHPTPHLGINSPDWNVLHKKNYRKPKFVL